MAKAESRRILGAARAKSNVKLEQVADALEVSVSLVDAIFFTKDKAERRKRRGKKAMTERYLKYADLYLLATHPETVAMARELMAPLNAIFDRHRLTLQDVDGLSNSPITIDFARVALRPTLERLFPAEMRSTLEAKP